MELVQSVQLVEHVHIAVLAAERQDSSATNCLPRQCTQLRPCAHRQFFQAKYAELEATLLALHRDVFAADAFRSGRAARAGKPKD